ncbi:tetratricopeptide repeat protein [Nocardiopsis lambiniae]|uniref:Tetratricopeptide repeat protein n=1 Tax=Nocardiopsis lambiniae TaxID=3075539 RepID=A0ABU2M2Y5_9ACTN|nr:tetratricopeptide repeat protein [Nocardiopsis sp. DSM 44743]MDT0327008.1 tetratricopeptide repeat protein [Nocardiopsis sp. DSM 44743]
MTATASGYGVAIGVAHGDIRVTHIHRTKQLSWPVVLGQVPPRAGHFQHRREEERLDRLADDRHAVVLAGMGGVGKTQLAAHHARGLWESGRVDLVVWVPASSRSRIVQTYAQAAHHLLDGAVPEEPGAAAVRFLSWLQTTDKRWLVVLDNLDDPFQVQGLWPPTTPVPHPDGKGFERREGAVAGRVVVTTRRTDLHLPGLERSSINVGLYTPEESLHYLRQALGGLPALQEELDELAEELGHLPLALTHATAFLHAREGRMGCTAYLARFRNHRRALDRNFPDQPLEDYPATVATTWKISIEYADTLIPQGLSSPLMRLIALLDPTGIPLAILTSEPVLEYLARGDDARHPPETDDVIDALELLHRLHLVTLTGTETSHVSEGDGVVVTVHRLVQRATREDPDLRPDRALVDVAADTLAGDWPDTVHATVHGQRLRSNTTVLASHAGDWLWEPEGHLVLFRLGSSLGGAGAVSEAIAYWRDMTRTAERNLGADHPNTLTTRNNLANWRGEGGDVAGAVAEFEAVLDAHVRVLGADHPDTLATRSNLASWRGEGGDVAGAVAEFEAVLDAHVRVLGADHPDTLITWNNLASWRGEGGDVTGAVAEFEAVLDAHVRVLGADHPNTLTMRNNLALWRGRSGDVAGAAAESEAVLDARSRVLGADHPDTLITWNNLASWRGEGGDVAGAVAEFETLLDARSRVLGADHPDTLITWNNLAFWRGEGGDVAGAVTEFEAVSRVQSRVLGADHPNTLTTRNNLAFCRGEAGDVAGAAAESEALIEDRSRVLGADHPDTLTTRNNLERFRAIDPR